MLVHNEQNCEVRRVYAKWANSRSRSSIWLRFGTVAGNRRSDSDTRALWSASAISARSVSDCRVAGGNLTPRLPQIPA